MYGFDSLTEAKRDICNISRSWIKVPCQFTPGTWIFRVDCINSFGQGGRKNTHKRMQRTNHNYNPTTRFIRGLFVLSEGVTCYNIKAFWNMHLVTPTVTCVLKSWESMLSMSMHERFVTRPPRASLLCTDSISISANLFLVIGNS